MGYQSIRRRLIRNSIESRWGFDASPSLSDFKVVCLDFFDNDHEWLCISNCDNTTTECEVQRGIRYRYGYVTGPKLTSFIYSGANPGRERI